jgi:hypothetical protein
VPASVAPALPHHVKAIWQQWLELLAPPD